MKIINDYTNNRYVYGDYTLRNYFCRMILGNYGSNCHLPFRYLFNQLNVNISGEKNFNIFLLFLRGRFLVFNFFFSIFIVFFCFFLFVNGKGNIAGVITGLSSQNKTKKGTNFTKQ